MRPIKNPDESQVENLQQQRILAQQIRIFTLKSILHHENQKNQHIPSQDWTVYFISKHCSSDRCTRENARETFWVYRK